MHISVLWQIFFLPYENGEFTAIHTFLLKQTIFVDNLLGNDFSLPLYWTIFTCKQCINVKYQHVYICNLVIY